MNLVLTRYVTTALIIITDPVTLFLTCLISVSVLLHCELVRILFLQSRNITRTCSVSTFLFSSPNSNPRLATSSSRLHPQSYVSTFTSMTLLQIHTHTHPPTHKHLVSYPLPSHEVFHSPILSPLSRLVCGTVLTSLTELRSPYFQW